MSASGFGILTDDVVVRRVAEETDAYIARFPEIGEDIDAAGMTLHHLVDLVPVTTDNVFSGNLFPLLEATYEYESGVMFARMGYYKHAMIASRNLLELGMLSVYWDVEDQSHIDIQTWLRSQGGAFTPNRGKIVKRLMETSNVKTFSEQDPEFFDGVAALYDSLSAYVHTRGAGASSHAFGHSNLNDFDPTALALWRDHLRSAVQIVLCLHLLKYPVGLQTTTPGRSKPPATASGHGTSSFEREVSITAWPWPPIQIVSASGSSCAMSASDPRQSFAASTPMRSTTLTSAL